MVTDVKLLTLTNGELHVTGRLVDASNATLYATATLEDQAIVCIYKPIAGERPLWDFADGCLAHREYAAYLVSHHLGFDLVPLTILRDGPYGFGMVQQWIDIDESIDLAKFFATDHPKLRSMALFDAIINNTDRKIGHLLPEDDQRLFGCDHGVTFHAEDKLRTVLWQWADDRFTPEEVDLLKRAQSEISGELGRKLSPLLTELEIQQTARRIADLVASGSFPLPNPDWPRSPVAGLLNYEYDRDMRSWTEVVIPSIDSSLKFPALQLTNSASGTKELTPPKPLYRMYVCGITPYDATHLGHAATYLTFDLIHRYLRASGSQVRYVQNITDIDDPLLERAKRDGVDWTELAHQQIDLFRSDMINLRVIPPTHYIGAVDAIPLVTDAIKVLSSKDSIYSVEQDLYFKVHSDSQFGQRSHLSQDKMMEIFAERGGDPTRVGKIGPLDCLVWMSQRPNEPGWPSPFGTGRPGWHIECTAIAIKYLEPAPSEDALIDIQGGGSDLIFPHHEMCAAQAQILTGKPLAHTYVHAGMIGLDGEKMSKSKGNLVFVSKLVAAGRDPMAIRWALMKDHYRQDRMWTDELLVTAESELNALRYCLAQTDVAPTKDLVITIVNALSDDLDTQVVITALNAWVRRTQSGDSGGDAKTLVTALDALLGIKL